MVRLWVSQKGEMEWRRVRQVTFLEEKNLSIDPSSWRLFFTDDMGVKHP